MAHTTGLVRGGLVINKVFIDPNKLHKNVKENTTFNTLDVQKQ